MTIPNVTIRWCQNQAKCPWCEQLIEPGHAMVVVFFWNKGEGNRRWNTQFCYHPECWLKQGYDYLERNPFVPYARGRKKANITDEQRRERFLITRRFHSLVQRRNNLTGGSAPLTVLKLECKMADLVLEMQRLGGVPKKWIEKL